MRGLYTGLVAAAVLVTTTLAFVDRSALPPSSPRKTINFDPIVDTRSASLQSSSEGITALAAINDQLREHEAIRRFREWWDDASGGLHLGMVVAEVFLREHVLKLETDSYGRWDDRLRFEITGSHLSNHSKVGHFYAIQVHQDRAMGPIDIGNAVASVHIDLDPSSLRFGHVLSYSESAHRVPLYATEVDNVVNWHHVAELDPEWASREQNWKEPCEISAAKKMEELAAEEATARSAIGQQTLGFDAAAAANSYDGYEAPVFNPRGWYDDELVECVAAAASAHLDRDELYAPAKRPVDPRLALLSLLSVVGDSDTLAHLASSSADDLIETMEIEETFEWYDSLDLHLRNVPGSIILDHAPKGAPVKAKLQWLSVPSPSKAADEEEEKVLQLVWRFEYRSNLNWYDAYVDATRPGLIVSVTDWVKDFRPPTEVAEHPQEHYAMLKSLRETLSSASYAELYPRSPKTARTAAKPPHPLNATYKVFPWSVNDPSEGEREVIYAPHHPIASEAGWHRIPPRDLERRRVWTKLAESEDWINEPGWSTRTSRGMNLTDTRGNNVFAQENWEGYGRWENNGRPDGSANLTFDFGLHWGPRENMTGKHIDPKSYINASVTELFYTCNEVHDLFHLYGFDEAAGNFQENNFERGGIGGDAVIANSQDGSGYNNANFATPPDGQHGQMRMYVWNGAHPWRDGDLEAGIVIHEYAHGISTRLTGGPANSGCLAWGESGGMGEGWGDFFATLIRMHHKKARDFSMGEWASRMKGGIRKYKYSLNHTTEPETYKVLDGPAYFGVHAIGEVWAEMLYTVAETLIKKHGFEYSLFPPLDDEGSSKFYTNSAKTGKRHPMKGNTLTLQLVVDGMKLQPCRPKFMDARDAIIQADEILTGGENVCDIWEAFASRGLGPKAALRGSTPWGGGIREEDYGVPKKCHKTK